MTAQLFSDQSNFQRYQRRAIDLLTFSKVDPTKTNGVRARFERELIRRFKKLAADAASVVSDPNFLRLQGNDSSDKVEKFLRWLRKKQDEEILEITKGSPGKSGDRRWSDLYLRSAYQKGLAQAYGNIRAKGIKVEQGFIDAAFYRPIHADRAGLIYTRAYRELKGITDSIDSKLSGVLAQGIIEGRHPKAIAREISKNILSIGTTRSKVIARTEVVRAHSEATLNSYEEAGIEGVDVQSEFTTSKDNKVCEKCSGLEGRTYTIQEARGIIPVHPNCRCAWLPVVDASQKGRRIG